MACSHYISGASKPVNWTGEPHATVKIKLDFDGSIVVLSGAADIGQGSTTILAQSVAEVLGLDLARVRVVTGDSEVVPKDNGSYSSRVTFMVGNAAIDAAQNLKAVLIAAAARKLEAKPGEIECLGELYRAGAQDKGLTFNEVVTEALKDTGTITVTGNYSTIPESHGGKKYRGSAIGGTMGYSYSAQVVEVSVDEETGVVTVDKVWVAHDCGKALNRLTVEGQVQGSVWMGMGQAMSEEAAYHEGLMLTANMLDYRVPTIQDSPPIEVGIVESIDPHGPFGAKEAGEGSLAAFLPALTNAIADAVGLRFNDLPVTPDRVFAALEKRARTKSKAQAERRCVVDALPQFNLVRPRTLPELVAARAAHSDSRLIGGGTDLMVNIRRGIVAPPVLIDINGVAELRGIKADAHGLEIGAAATLTEVAAHPDVAKHYPVVAQAAAHIAGPTHRNMGTVGGNLALDTRCIFYNQSEWWRDANHHCLKTTGDICHVAPKSRGVCFATFSGDLAPALLTLDAEIDVVGPSGRRTMPLADLYIGYARQDEPVTETRGDGKYFLSLRAGEFIAAVRAKNTAGLRSAYDKIRIRRSIEYPVTGVAVALRRDGDKLTDLRVAFTGTNPRPVRLAGTAALVRRRARRWRARRARRAGARPDHGDEDDVYARPLPPPRRRRLGAAVGAALVRGLNLAKQKIYSPNQVLAASLLGGPMAMVYVLWKNFQTLENPHGMHQILFWGSIFIIGLMLFSPLMPNTWPDYVLPFGYSLAGWSLAGSFQMSKQAIRGFAKLRISIGLERHRRQHGLLGRNDRRRLHLVLRIGRRRADLIWPALVHDLVYPSRPLSVQKHTVLTLTLECSLFVLREHSFLRGADGLRS